MTTEKLYLVATEDGKINGGQFKTQEATEAGKVWGIDTDGTTKLLEGAGNFVPLDKLVYAGATRAGLYTTVGADSTTKVFANARFSNAESPTGNYGDLFTVYVNRVDSDMGSMVAFKANENKVYECTMSGGAWNGWTDITAGSTGGVILHSELHNMIGRLGVVNLMTNKSNGSVEVFGYIYFTASESPDKTGGATYAVYVHYLSAQHWSMIAVDRYHNEIYMTSYYNGTLAPWTKVQMNILDINGTAGQVLARSDDNNSLVFKTMLTKENVPIIDNNTWMVSKYSREQLYQKCVTDGNVRIVLHNNFEDASERPAAGCQYYRLMAYRVERACTIIAFDVFDCRMFISDRDSNMGVEGVWSDWKEFAQVGYSYTKAESDAKYPLIGDVYTKTESDAKYVAKGSGTPTITMRSGWSLVGNGSSWICGSKYLLNITVRNDSGTAQGAADLPVADISGNPWDSALSCACFEAPSAHIASVLQTRILKIRCGSKVLPAGSYIPITGVIDWYP